MNRFAILFVIFVQSFNLSAQIDVRQFIFGHSLLDHRPPAIPTPSDETTVPHWMFLLSQEAGHNYAATGQYGFLPQHMNLPPIAQWGYDIVPPVWESDTEDFSIADFNSILITAANFAQWQGPNVPYYNDPNNTSPLSATRTISDWLVQQEDSMKVIIYENWPDMAGYMNAYPPTEIELDNYYNYTQNEFHDWWIEYHDSLSLQRPDHNIKMVPVGPILAELAQNTSIGNIPATELYEDDAPHGRASLYFIASLVTYMAVYEEKAPLTYVVPSIVHQNIANDYAEIVELIWTSLLNFNYDNGVSRVFSNDNIINSHVYLNPESIQIYPNPTTGIFHIKGNTSLYDIEVLDSMAAIYQSYSGSDNIVIDISTLPSGMYFVRMTNKANSQISVQKIIKD